MFKLQGMYAAIPTPFFPDESIDYDGLKKLTEFLVQGGLSGIIAGGSTGEFTLLSTEERKQVVKTACNAAAGRFSVVAGTGCHRAVDTIELCNYAAEVGADAALVITPHYLIMTEDELFRFYSEVAAESKIPVLIYHFAGATGVALSPEMVLRLSKIDNIVGIKNTEDMDHTAKIIGLTADNPDFDVAVGYDSLAVGTLATGGSASMGVVHNIVPGEMMKIYNAIRNNDVKTAMALNARLCDLVLLLEAEPYPGPAKAALELMGLPGGVPRKPVAASTPELREKMKECLTKLGVI